MKRLIVNADDFGRTPGINEGTLEAHLTGIVTSATVMVLEPAAAEGIARARETAPRLSLGLHFVLTGGGAPASPPAEVGMLAPGGRFRKNAEALPENLPGEEIRRELEAQIALLTKMGGRSPSHLDSHHHSALHPSVQAVFAEVAREQRLPVRAANAEARTALRAEGLRTPDHFVDSFYGEGATPEHLRGLLEGLSEGVSELMCHPGRADAPLLEGSSYARERERELRILCDRRVSDALKELEVRLMTFEEL